MTIDPIVLDAFGDTFDAGQKNPVVAQCWNDSVGAHENTSMTASIDKMLAGNEELKQNVGQILEGVQDGNLEVEELKAFAAQEFRKLNVVITDATTHLTAIDAQQKKLLDYAQRQEQARLLAEKERTEAKARKDRIEGSRAALSLICQLYRTVDPKAAKQMSAVGTATIDVATAISEWPTGMAALGLSDKEFKLAELLSGDSLVACANIVSAVSKCIEIFSGVKSPDAQILEQIAALREDIRAMRTEMRGRFDRVDSTLQTIYDVMLSRFDLIDTKLGRLNGDVGQTLVDLHDLRVRLDRFEGVMFDLVRDSSRQDLNQWLDYALGYREKHNGAVMPKNDFMTAESKFYTWAKVESFSRVNTAPTGWDYSDGEAVSQLKKYFPEANLNYLSEFCDQRYGTPLLSKAPNPRDWVLAARAYTRLISEWPDYATEINPQRSIEVAAVGDKLRDELSQVSTKRTPAGSFLVDRLCSEYEAAVKDLRAQLELLESKYRYIEPLHIDREAIVTDPAFRLSDQAEQEIKGKPGVPIQIACTLRAPTQDYLLRWDQAETVDMPAPYKLLALLRPPATWGRRNPGPVDVNCCWTAFMEGSSNGPSAPTLLHVQVLYRLGTTVVALREITKLDMRKNFGDPVQYVMKNWDADPVKGLRFQLQNATNVPSAVGLTLTNRVAQQLLDAEHGQMFALVAKEMVKDAAATTDSEKYGNVRSAIFRVKCAKGILENVLKLALPRSLEADDLLQALLYGSESISGDSLPQDLQTRYEAASAGITSPLAPFEQAMLERLAFLKARAGMYCQVIRAGELQDTMPLLDTAVARAELGLNLLGAARPSMSIKVSKKTLVRGARVTISGQITPARTGNVRITVQRKMSGRWKAVVTKTAALKSEAARSTYTWTWRPRAAGAYRVRATSPASAGVVKLATAYLAFRVR